MKYTKEDVLNELNQKKHFNSIKEKDYIPYVQVIDFDWLFNNGWELISVCNGLGNTIFYFKKVTK